MISSHYFNLTVLHKKKKQSQITFLPFKTALLLFAQSQITFIS